MALKDNTVYITKEGLAKLKEERERRETVTRVEIAQRLNEAIKMGDLKENADYHAAKEDQGLNEGRIRELIDLIGRSRIIEQAGNDIVGLGCSVTFAEVGIDDEDETYQIVGAQEANPAKGRISNDSPIGRALLGAKKGDTVTAKTPNGEIKFKVLEVA
jgi:transcription elongation factor GreA